MKNLSIKILLFSLIVCLFACGSSKNDSVIAQDDRLEVTFNRQMTFEDLSEIKDQLAKKDILIEYKSLEFDENGGLSSLKFDVDCKDGFKGGASNNRIYNDTKWGFFRDYSENSTSPFGTGTIQ